MSERPLLRPYQRRLVAGGITAVALTAIALFIAGVFWVLRWLVTSFSGVLWPLVVAGILTFLLKPIVSKLEERVRLSRTLAIVTLYALVVIVLAIGALAIIPVVVEQLIRAAGQTPVLLERAREILADYYPKLAVYLDPEDGLNSIMNVIADLSGSHSLWETGGPALHSLADWGQRVSGIAAGLGIIPVYLFYFLQSDRDLLGDLDTQLTFLKQEWREDLIYLIREFVEAVVVFFRGQVVIGLIMGVLLAIGFTAVGLEFGILLGLVIGMLNIVPYLGTILGLAMTLPVAYLQTGGGIVLLGMVVAVFVIVQVIEGYFLTPRIMGDATGLHPVVIIIAIFFWGSALNGILGMILAIPLTAFFVVAWRLVQRRYLVPLMHPENSQIRPIVDFESDAESEPAPVAEAPAEAAPAAAAPEPAEQPVSEAEPEPEPEPEQSEPELAEPAERPADSPEE